ncbi:MAG: hypothetical protein HPZ91_06475 [Lentisphaeria bacterium]|nr:hypothetical protein [Lentisphaeria bacterium]
MTRRKQILTGAAAACMLLSSYAETLVDLQIGDNGAAVANRIAGGATAVLHGSVPAGAALAGAASLDFGRAAGGENTPFIEVTGIGNPRSFSGSCTLRIDRTDGVGVLFFRRNKQTMWQFYLAPKGGRCHLFFTAWHYDGKAKKYRSAVELVSPDPLPLRSVLRTGFRFDPDGTAALLVDGREVASAKPEKPVVWGESDIRIGGDGMKRGLSAEIGEIRFGTGNDGLNR